MHGTVLLGVQYLICKDGNGCLGADSCCGGRKDVDVVLRNAYDHEVQGCCWWCDSVRLLGAMRCNAILLRLRFWPSVPVLERKLRKGEEGAEKSWYHGFAIRDIGIVTAS